MKNRLSLFLIFFFIFPILLLSIFLWWKWIISPPDFKDNKEEIFVIRRGENLNEIVQRLKNEGFIRNTLVFKFILKKDNLANKIQAGDFKLSRSMNSREIALQLQHGTLDIWVTIPEGLRSEEVYQILAKNFAIDFKSWQAGTKDKEGYLFPETYLIPKQATASMITKIMTDTFEEKSKNLGMINPQDIIMASLVEREAKFAKDRPIVAGILKKRLENDWPLEVDAAIQYAVNGLKCRPIQQDAKCWWSPVSPEDLKIDSAYNTYQNKGLPPTPISNPGLEAIKAAINPKETDYWFYLSDKAGNIHYAKTLEEQEANIEKYLK